MGSLLYTMAIMVALEKHKSAALQTSVLTPTSALCKHVQNLEYPSNRLCLQNQIFAYHWDFTPTAILLEFYSHCHGAVHPSRLPGKLAVMVKLTNESCTIQLNLHCVFKTI